jgi:hypothetical protein
VPRRRIKRLLQVPKKTSQDLRQSLENLSPKQIDAVLNELKKQSIPFDFIAFPDLIDRERDAYELHLAGAHANRPTLHRLGAILKAAGPLFILLRSEQDFFGSLADDLEQQLGEYRKQLFIQQRPKLPRHRPGDPWLRDWILFAARYMRKRHVPLKRIIRRIAAIFDIIGHGDLATPEKIRHIIRSARKTDPTFAALFAPGGGRTPRSRPK